MSVLTNRSSRESETVGLDRNLLQPRLRDEFHFAEVHRTVGVQVAEPLRVVAGGGRRFSTVWQPNLVWNHAAITLANDFTGDDQLGGFTPECLTACFKSNVWNLAGSHDLVVLCHLGNCVGQNIYLRVPPSTTVDNSNFHFVLRKLKSEHDEITKLATTPFSN